MSAFGYELLGETLDDVEWHRTDAKVDWAIPPPTRDLHDVSSHSSAEILRGLEGRVRFELSLGGHPTLTPRERRRILEEANVWEPGSHSLRRRRRGRDEAIYEALRYLRPSARGVRLLSLRRDISVALSAGLAAVLLGGSLPLVWASLMQRPLHPDPFTAVAMLVGALVLVFTVAVAIRSPHDWRDRTRRPRVR